MIAEILLRAAALYLACGVAFAIPFAVAGAGRIDPHAARATWGFRVLIVPGAVFLWPLLAWRWMQGIHQPPEENNPHRRAARTASSGLCDTGHDLKSVAASLSSDNNPSLAASALRTTASEDGSAATPTRKEGPP